MTDINKLKDLLRSAYDAGFRDGNGYDTGCQPEHFGHFEEWLEKLSAGDFISAIAELSAQSAPMLTSGTIVPFRMDRDREIEMVVQSIHRNGYGVTVELQDRETAERVLRYRQEDPF